MPNEIISSSTLRVFQEYLVSTNTMRGIQDLFEDANILPLDGHDPPDSSVRRSLIRQYYASLDLHKWSDVKKLLKVFEDILFELRQNIKGWSSIDNQKVLDRSIEYLKRDGFTVEDNKIVFSGDPSILSIQGISNEEDIPAIIDLFQYQFPAGLPFGITKPDFAIASENGFQRLHFEIKQGMGLLRSEVYPNFTFRNLEHAFGVDQRTNTSIKQALVRMNQTKMEKDFFLAYARTFNMADANVPALVPQAWMQWHSAPKRDLRSDSSIHADDLYRVDFVAFWENRRYAILIDDIGHYAKKIGNTWQADEEAYSKRLKEDRKLRKDRWQVFRISNWEIRNQLLPEILNDLRYFIGFE